MRRCGGVTCASVRVQRVWVIKGKTRCQLLRHIKSLLSDLCCDWWRGRGRRPRCSQSERLPKLCPTGCVVTKTAACVGSLSPRRVGREWASASEASLRIFPGSYEGLNSSGECEPARGGAAGWGTGFGTRAAAGTRYRLTTRRHDATLLTAHSRFFIGPFVSALGTICFGSAATSNSGFLSVLLW